MSYTVTLYQDINMPYVINDISAHNENDAIYKAKKFVATNGYFPYMSTEQVMNILVVKKLERTNEIGISRQKMEG